MEKNIIKSPFSISSSSLVKDNNNLGLVKYLENLIVFPLSKAKLNWCSRICKIGAGGYLNPISETHRTRETNKLKFSTLAFFDLLFPQTN